MAQILPNETYIGWTVFDKRDKKRVGKQFKPEDEWIIIKNTHEPIISEELFNGMQKLIQERHYEAIESGKIDLSLVAERLKELRIQRENQQPLTFPLETKSSVYLSRVTGHAIKSIRYFLLDIHNSLFILESKSSSYSLYREP